MLHDLRSESSFIIGDNRFGQPVRNIFDVRERIPSCRRVAEGCGCRSTRRYSFRPSPTAEANRRSKADRDCAGRRDRASDRRSSSHRRIRQRVGRVFHAVKSLRFEPLPPLIFSCRLGEIGHRTARQPADRICRRHAKAGTTTSCAPDALSHRTVAPASAPREPMCQSHHDGGRWLRHSTADASSPTRRSCHGDWPKRRRFWHQRSCSSVINPSGSQFSKVHCEQSSLYPKRDCGP